MSSLIKFPALGSITCLCSFLIRSCPPFAAYVLSSSPHSHSHTLQSSFKSTSCTCIMRFSLLPVLAAGLAIAAPTEKRADFAAPPGGDITILNYALTLEYLERAFYAGGLKNFTQAQFVAAGFADPFYSNLKEVYVDEQVCQEP